MDILNIKCTYLNTIHDVSNVLHIVVVWDIWVNNPGTVNER